MWGMLIISRSIRGDFFFDVFSNHFRKKQKQNPSCWDTALCFAVLRSRFSSFRFVPVKVRTLNKPTEASLFFQPSALTVVNKELSLSSLLPLLPLNFSQFPLMQQALIVQFYLCFKVGHYFLSLFQVDMPWRTAFLYGEGKPIQTGLSVSHSSLLYWTKCDVRFKLLVFLYEGDQ